MRIEGVDYIDGGVKKTAHISLALRERCGLTVCVNPLVPVRVPPEPTRTATERARFDGAACPTILDQVFRRHAPLAAQVRPRPLPRGRPPTADVVVFEPRPEDLPRYMRNIMRTSGRIRIAEYAYRSTMATLDADFKRLPEGLRAPRPRPEAGLRARPLRA